MSHQYQPTAYYDWVNRTHGVHLVTGNYQLVPYDYYAGDELHIQNVVFRNSEYVTYDNTHVRFLNKSDIHVYDTSSLVIHDSGTLTMHTSSAPGARTFIVDEIGRVGIGMNHLGVHANHPESPSFDLDVRGQVGIEDYIYHNDDTDTYMLFGTDTKSHHVNADGSITPPITPPNQDYDEVNFRVGGVDMLQMKEDDTQDEFVVNKNQADVDTIIRTSTNTQAVVVSGDGSEVVINGDGNSDTDFRVEGDTTPHMLYVDTSEDHVTINGAANDDTDLFTVTGNDNASLSGASLLSVSPTAVVINEDSNLIDTRIESNTNTTSILVKGDGSEVVVNDDGNSDTDFRVEGDKTPNLLFIDTSEDHVKINGAANDDTDLLTVLGNSNANTIGANLFKVNPEEVVVNESSNDVNFRIESNTNTHALYVDGDGTEVVVNDDGNSDTDFRIESDKSEKMLFVDTSTDMITLSGPGGGDDTAILDIQGNDDDDLTGASLLYVDPTETVLNKDANDHNFRVVAQGLDPQQDITDTGTDSNVQNHTAALASHALFVDATNGRVGLGHNNPATTLHVAGSAHIEGDLWVKGNTNQVDTFVHVTSAMDIINIGTGPALTVTQTGAQPVATFMDDSVPALVIEDGGADRSGFVGLGLADPTRNLHIHRLGGESTDHAYAQFTTGDTGATVTDGLHVGYDASDIAIISNMEETDLILKTNNTTALTVSGVGQHVAVGPSGNTFTTLYVEATDGLRVPIGTVGERPLPSAFDITIAGDDYNNFASGISESAPMLGTIRYNTEHSTFEGFGAGNQWGSLGGVIDVDRDTYWTAVNDLNNLHDLGEEKEGEDEFDVPTKNTNYPGDVDYLRAFTYGEKRFAITDTGASKWYHKSSGTGTTADPYKYSNFLEIIKTTSATDVLDGVDITAPTGSLNIEATGGSKTGHVNISATNQVDITADVLDVNIAGATTIDSGGSTTLTTGGGLDVNVTGSCAIDSSESMTLKTANDKNILISAGVTPASTTGDITLTSELVTITNHNASTRGLKLGSTLVTATGDELNIMDGSATTQATVTLEKTDGVVINDGNTMTQCLVSDFTVRLSTDITNLPNLVQTGALTQGTIASGFGTISTGNNITTTAALQGGSAAITSAITAGSAAITNAITAGSAAITNAITAGSATLGTLGTLDTSLAGTPFVLSIGGNLRADGDVIAFATSDERFKDNVIPIPDPIDKIKKIGGYEFDWNDKSQYTGHDVGVLAQEVEQVLPEVVKTRYNGDKAVNYEKIIPLLIECIKSQQKQIDELKELVNK